MGQCGCGDMDATWKLPGPDGVTYALGIYSGCRDCSSPAGVTFTRMTDEDLEDWEDLKELPELPFCDDMSGIQVVYPGHVKRLLLAQAEDPDLGEYGIDGFIEDMVPEAVRDAAAGCYYQQERRARPIPRHPGDYSERLDRPGFYQEDKRVQFGCEFERDIEPGDQVWRTVVGNRADFVLVRDGIVVSELLDRILDKEERVV